MGTPIASVLDSLLVLESGSFGTTKKLGKKSDFGGKSDFGVVSRLKDRRNFSLERIFLLSCTSHPNISMLALGPFNGIG
ncbi:MAG: hypothetical protein DRR19_00615 [Candidatus Parabeggiatoa sp. nov. 1]|nr:MAG: hypothetical protein DRR19_00615 [Gammaproteobacteria bacterium]